jgi:hypothetical protein
LGVNAVATTPISVIQPIGALIQPIKQKDARLYQVLSNLSDNLVALNNMINSVNDALNSLTTQVNLATAAALIQIISQSFVGATTSPRFSIKLVGTETGGNAGSNFTLVLFADNGTTILETPISINRATGVITLSGSVNITGNTTITGNLGVTGTMPALPNVGTPGTYDSVTTDAQGRVTGGTGSASGLSLVITTAKLTVGGANGSMTFTSGRLTSEVAAT